MGVNIPEAERIQDLPKVLCPTCGKRAYVASAYIRKFTLELIPGDEPDRESLDIEHHYFCDRTPACEAQEDFVVVQTFNRQAILPGPPPVQPAWPR